MLEAGIIDVNAIMYPVHVWPIHKDGSEAVLSADEAKQHLLTGQLLDLRHGRATIYDIPEGTNVILHASRDEVRLCIEQ